MEEDDEEDEEDEEDDDEEEEDEAEFEGEDASSGRAAESSNNSQSKKQQQQQQQQQPTLDERARFSANLLLLNGSELGYVVRTIECECPEAIEIGQALPEKMEIVVDSLDPDLFTKLGEFAEEKAAQRRRTLNISTSAPAIIDISNKRKRKR